MVDWQITATTIYCDAIDGEATLLVHKDKQVKCATYKKYGQPDKKLAALLKEKSKQMGRHLKCEGPVCERMTGYRNRLFSEEPG